MQGEAFHPHDGTDDGTTGWHNNREQKLLGHDANNFFLQRDWIKCQAIAQGHSEHDADVDAAVAVVVEAEPQSQSQPQPEPPKSAKHLPQVSNRRRSAKFKQIAQTMLQRTEGKKLKRKQK